MRSSEPDELPRGRGKVRLVWLVASQEVDLAESAPASLLDHGREQNSCRVAPSVPRQPSTLVQAQPAGELEAAHRGDDLFARDELVEGDLAARCPDPAGRPESLVGGQEVRPLPPLRAV
jgi:hypothetical protein